MVLHGRQLRTKELGGRQHRNRRRRLRGRVRQLLCVSMLLLLGTMSHLLQIGHCCPG
jgi:hypothetical protein